MHELAIRHGGTGWRAHALLGELTGPTAGVVELPLHLDWSELGLYDVSDLRRRNLTFEVVIRASMRVEDLHAIYPRLDHPLVIR